MRKLLFASAALTGLALGIFPYAVHAGHRAPETVKEFCRLTPPPEPVDADVPSQEGQDVVVTGWRVNNKTRMITLSSCAERHVSYRVTPREFRVRLDSSQRWGDDLLVMKTDKEHAPVGVISFPGSTATCEYQVRMVYQGFSRSDRTTIERKFNVCRYGSMVVHVDTLKPDSTRGGQAMASLGE
jgi:hypothetical protein